MLKLYFYIRKDNFKIYFDGWKLKMSELFGHYNRDSTAPY